MRETDHTGDPLGQWQLRGADPAALFPTNILESDFVGQPLNFKTQNSKGEPIELVGSGVKVAVGEKLLTGFTSKGNLIIDFEIKVNSALTTGWTNVMVIGSSTRQPSFALYNGKDFQVTVTTLSGTFVDPCNGVLTTLPVGVKTGVRLMMLSNGWVDLYVDYQKVCTRNFAADMWVRPNNLDVWLTRGDKKAPDATVSNLILRTYDICNVG